ncbi:MAG: class I SAM-dependent methyltransferase [Pirellulales bacterium]
MRTPVEHCEICHGTHFTGVGSRDRSGKPLRTVVCEGCGLVFSNPRPSTADLRAFYRESYRITYKHSWQPSLKHIYRGGHVARQRLRHVMPFLTPGSSVLDFGSGGGEFVFMLRELGHDARGIEPNVGYAEYSRDALGIPVQIGGFDEAQVQDESLDLVTLFHVAEHLEHPVEAFRKAAEWLRFGGRLYVEVPNVENQEIWPTSRFHEAHLYNFNAATLAHAGRRAGLHPVSSFPSSDGGNVSAVFVKTKSDFENLPAKLPGNADRVRRILRDHNVVSHFFTVHPYLRPLRKLQRYLRERRGIACYTDGQGLLRVAVKKWRDEEGSAEGPVW